MSKPQSRARSAYSKYGASDPFQLYSQLNIDIRYLDSRKNFLIKFIKGTSGPVVILNSLLIEKNERYYLLAYELYFALCSAEASEKDAHCFAKALLTQLYIDTYGNVPGGKELEARYGVPPDFTQTYIFSLDL